jgi:hypothetical protein
VRADNMTADTSTVPYTVHFTLQGKGGVGKSLVAAIIAQYFKSIGAATPLARTSRCLPRTSLRSKKR